MADKSDRKGPKREGERIGVDGVVVLVTGYHVVLIGVCVVTFMVMYRARGGVAGPTAYELAVYSFLFGVLGATLNASRTVVMAVGLGKYDVNRRLWQYLTPLHGGVLGLIAVIAVSGGVVPLAGGNGGAGGVGASGTTGGGLKSDPTNFVIAFASIVGFASDMFVARMKDAARTLFGSPDAREMGEAEVRDELKKGRRGAASEVEVKPKGLQEAGKEALAGHANSSGEQEKKDTETHGATGGAAGGSLNAKEGGGS